MQNDGSSVVRYSVLLCEVSETSLLWKEKSSDARVFRQDYHAPLKQNVHGSPSGNRHGSWRAEGEEIRAVARWVSQRCGSSRNH